MEWDSDDFAALEPAKDDDSTWTIRADSVEVAKFHLDHRAQLETVVLLPNVGSCETAVLRLAASHASRYVVERRSSNFVLIAEYTGRASQEDSDRLMADGEVPEAVRRIKDRHDLRDALKQIGVEVLDAFVIDFTQALQVVLYTSTLMALPVGLVEAKRSWSPTKITLTFEVPAPHQFRAWHAIHRPSSGNDNHNLHIVPAYHPAMSDRKYAFLVNGDTNALINGGPVDSVYAPGDEPGPGEAFSTSWNHPPHPYRVEGSRVILVIDMVQALTFEGITAITQVLSALLEQDGAYLAVSGGFRSKMEYPQNLVSRGFVQLSPGVREARGSEGYAAWCYEVLQEEKALEGAYVPPWFYAEGWLTAYQTNARTEEDLIEESFRPGSF